VCEVMDGLFTLNWPGLSLLLVNIVDMVRHIGDSIDGVTTVARKGQRQEGRRLAGSQQARGVREKKGERTWQARGERCGVPGENTPAFNQVLPGGAHTSPESAAALPHQGGDPCNVESGIGGARRERPA
jgi:hypothetical protein